MLIADLSFFPLTQKYGRTGMCGKVIYEREEEPARLCLHLLFNFFSFGINVTGYACGLIGDTGGMVIHNKIDNHKCFRETTQQNGRDTCRLAQWPAAARCAFKLIK